MLLFSLCRPETCFLSIMSSWLPINQLSFFVLHHSSLFFLPLFRTVCSVLVSLICRLSSAKIRVTKCNCLFLLSAELLIKSMSSAILHSSGRVLLKTEWIEVFISYVAVVHSVTTSSPLINFSNFVHPWNSYSNPAAD